VLGIFHPQRKLQPDVGIVVSQHRDEDLMRDLGCSALDRGILTRPREIPDSVEVTHRMVDHFILVISGGTPVPSSFKSTIGFRKWANARRWLLPTGKSRSREIIDDWAMGQKIDLHPVMELEGFDLMLEFAAMGMGATLIPRRCLGLFRRKHQIKVVHPPVAFSRQLIVIAPRHSKRPEHVTRFVEGILLS
jgi:DNA-binding transcriptional LysR family regulator